MEGERESRRGKEGERERERKGEREGESMNELLYTAGFPPYFYAKLAVTWRNLRHAHLIYRFNLSISFALLQNVERSGRKYGRERVRGKGMGECGGEEYIEMEVSLYMLLPKCFLYTLSTGIPLFFSDFPGQSINSSQIFINK